MRSHRTTTANATSRDLMKKKGKSMKTKKTVKAPHKDLYHLTMCLKLTEQSIKGDSEDLDSYFISQAEKLREKIRGLK